MSRLATLQGAKSDGATLLTGGNRPKHLPKGYFVKPTVFINVKPEMRLWQEEVFGPVLASATFSTEEEAVTIANSSEFGLAGAVITADPPRCLHTEPPGHTVVHCLHENPASRQALSVSHFPNLHECQVTLGDHDCSCTCAHCQAATDDGGGRCQRVAEALECGIVWKNCSQPCFCNVPW